MPDTQITGALKDVPSVETETVAAEPDALTAETGAPAAETDALTAETDDAAPEPDALFADPRLAACYDTFDGERDDLDHYESILAELGAHAVLDVGCGTGSLAVRLAAQSKDVIGIDPALASLDVARNKPHAEAVMWVHGTAPELPALGADAAVMTGNVAQVFLTDAEWSATLRGIHRALRSGGSFIVESRRPEARAWEQWAAETGEQSWVVPGVGLVVGRPHPVRVEWPLVTFGDDFSFEDGAVVSSTSTLRFRDEDELRASLVAAGFSVTEIRQAPDRPGREFVVIARAD